MDPLIVGVCSFAAAPGRACQRSDIQKSMVERVIKIITEQGRATPVQLQNMLGLSRHAWYKVAAPLRKTGRVDFIERKYYVPRRERLL